jgi:hypothetical protein
MVITTDLGAPIPATGLLYLAGIAIAVLILAYMISTLLNHNQEKRHE